MLAPVMPPDWPWLALVVPTVVEMLMFHFRPTWLARFALIAAQERTFVLRSLRTNLNEQAGYRDSGRRGLSAYRVRSPGEVSPLVALPSLPERTGLPDSVLFVRGDHIALRRALWLVRRDPWVVGIAVERRGTEVVMCAKQALWPMTVPVAAVGVLLTVGTWSGAPLTAMVVAMLVSVAVGVVRHFLSRGGRDEEIRLAFDVLEEELRTALEEPTTSNGA